VVARLGTCLATASAAAAVDVSLACVAALLQLSQDSIALAASKEEEEEEAFVGQLLVGLRVLLPNDPNDDHDESTSVVVVVVVVVSSIVADTPVRVAGVVGVEGGGVEPTDARRYSRSFRPRCIVGWQPSLWLLFQWTTRTIVAAVLQAYHSHHSY
jgi:hypothetical protein